MKIQMIRDTKEMGLVADVWLTPRSILSVSIPVDQCTLEALVEYAIRDDEHDNMAIPAWQIECDERDADWMQQTNELRNQ